MEFGLGREHIAELSRLACDRVLNDGDPDSREAWAPLHAWRVLGQLQAETSVAPMLAFLKTAESDDAVTEEFPSVLGMIGRLAIPHIERFLSDRSNPTFSVATAIAGLEEIAERHPDCRTECVNILARTLEQHADADGSINGFAVSALIDLAAVEVIDAIREAFRRNSVDICRSPVTKRMWKSRWVSEITVPRPRQFIKLCPSGGLHRRVRTVSSGTIERYPNTARSVVTIHARAAAERNIRSAAYNSA